MYHLQCLFFSLIHVKSGNKLCNTRSTRFSNSFEVSLFWSCPSFIFSLGLWNSVHLEMMFYITFRVRMHYGHPDVFDRVFHITRGGISKASRIINISEDIFAGNGFWLVRLPVAVLFILLLWTLSSAFRACNWFVHWKVVYLKEKRKRKKERKIVSWCY